MNFRVLAFGLLLGACAMRPPLVADMGNDNWASPLDQDLRAAVAAHQQAFDGEPWKIQIRWAGTRGAAYNIERGPTGEPLRQSVPVLYAFAYPSRGKCFLSPESSSNEWEVRLAREHIGGGQYGPPRLIGLGAMRDDGQPTGAEVVCSAIDRVNGGVHVGAADGSAAAATDAPKPQARTGDAGAPTQPYDPERTLARLDADLPPACREYARATCLNPNVPAGTNREYFCEHLVDRTNVEAKKPGAAKKCDANLKNMRR